MCQILTEQSSLPVAIKFWLWGDQARSRIGPLCPLTIGWSHLILVIFSCFKIKDEEKFSLKIWLQQISWFSC